MRIGRVVGGLVPARPIAIVGMRTLKGVCSVECANMAAGGADSGIVAGRRFRSLRMLASRNRFGFGNGPRGFIVCTRTRHVRSTCRFSPLFTVGYDIISPLPRRIRTICGFLLPRPGVHFLLTSSANTNGAVVAKLLLGRLVVHNVIRHVLVVAPKKLAGR